MEPLTRFFKDLWDTFIMGPAPALNNEHLMEGASGRGLKWKITYRVNKILKEFPNHKFGKSGQPPNRAKYKDYREAPHTNMFLLYQSESADDVSDMEVYYIKRYKHLKNNENKSELRTHPMRSYDGKYYLYLVAN